jgi:hypothetical protein
METPRVRCAKCPPRYKGPHPTFTDPEIGEEYARVNVCSNGPKWAAELSPMNLGPIIVEEVYHPDILGALSKKEATKKMDIPYREGYVYSVCNTIEALWQASKVKYSELDGDTILETFFQERNRWWHTPGLAPKQLRRCKGREWAGIYYNGALLSYSSARKLLYCRAYAELVVETKAWKRLVELRDEGGLLIYGFDGYDFDSEGKTLQDCINDTSRPFGHELVLVSLLRGEKPWL